VLALAVTVAIVVHDPTILVASPDENAARQAVLAPGDWLEVRGELRGRLKVYDHRRERPGYVLPWQVRTYPLDESAAPALRAVIDFVRDTPGAESLGIGYVALYLKVAPAAAIGPDVLDALGTMAERLARRRAPVEVAESYGVHFTSVEVDGAIRTCYDGEAFRQVLAAANATADARARAALALTDPRCGSAGLEVLDKADGDRVRLRRARLLASEAWQRARRGDGPGAAEASQAAQDALTGVVQTELAPEDMPSYKEAAVRVSAVRWLREPGRAPGGKVHLELAAREPGETCVRLVEAKATKLEKCTYGLVFPQSTRLGPRDASLTVQVQLLPAWVELWVFRRAGDGWIVDPIAAAESNPDVGTVELAGFSQDGKRLRVVRETPARRNVEVRLVANLARSFPN
jgi:hypothetical protein